jgi:Fe-S-cluster containining protein
MHRKQKTIPITKLKESDVPASDAPWPVIESFALSLNGYKAIPNDKP